MADTQSPPQGSVYTIEPVAGGHGSRWWADAISWLFGDLSRLGVWIGMLICFLFLEMVLGWIPILGHLAANLLWFVCTGGLMVAASKTRQGQAPRFADLFAGFGPQAGALFSAGLIVLLASVAVFGLMMAIGVGAILASVFHAVSLSGIDEQPIASLSIGWGTLLLLLLCLLLFIPISMAAWLAPALIMLRGAGPVDALRMSLAACQRNVGALTVYGLIFFGLAIVASIVFMIGWFFLSPLYFLSTYAAYCELFEGAPEAPLPGASPSAG